ncbi:MAG: 6-carboxytetrahydropterin synthase [Chitinivibrionales bacterium]|nr:6-carboxytetrahydropterin synthase [Chitinivibrionales bacterium]
MYEITTTSHFSSAHRLLHYDGPCENLHGHNWQVKACVRCGILNKAGIGIDFKLLKAFLKEITDNLDHTDLNVRLKDAIANPSSELLAKYVFEQLAKKLAPHSGCKVSRVEIYETPDNCAAYFKKS